jgi:hypothetical protein
MLYSELTHKLLKIKVGIKAQGSCRWRGLKGVGIGWKTLCFERAISNVAHRSCRNASKRHTLLATVLLINKGLSGGELHLGCDLAARKNPKSYK